MLTIKDLIQHAAREIEAAAQERIANDQLPLLAVDSVTIEANVVITEGTEGSGGFDLKVVTASGKKNYENQQIQKITVTLKVIPEDERSKRMFDAASVSVE